MQERYLRNAPSLSDEDMETLQKSRAVVIGCGGLGGYVIEELCRIGAGHLTLIDGDIFSQSNLNRQLLSSEANMGKLKAQEAKARARQINSATSVDIHELRLNEENADTLLSGHDVMIDATDNIRTRLLLQDCCDRLNIPLVHGAVAGWYAQVSTVFPGDGTLRRIYHSAQAPGASQPGTLSFSPAVAASVETAEAVKVLLKKGVLLRNRLLVVNLLDHSYDIIQI